MNIIFEKIQIQNFKSIGPLVVLDLQNLTGLNYIFGTNLDIPSSKNGSGKSVCFVDSIIFALFGKTLKNTNNQYIPNRNCDISLKSYVKLYFSVDGEKYTSECFCKPKIGTVGMQLMKLVNEETDEWQDLTQSSVVKTRQYIQDNILGCSFEIFKSSVIVSASDCLNFYEGMNKQAKRNYVENIFNLDCFGVMFSEIKSDLNDIKKEITYTNNELLKTTEQVEDITKKYEEFNSKVLDSLNEVTDAIKENVQKLKNNELIIAQQTQKLRSYQNILQLQLKTNNNLTALKNKKQEFEKDKIRLEYRKKSITDVLKEIISLKQGLCEKCTSVIDERYDYNTKKNEIITIQDNEKVLVDKINKLNLYIEKYQNELTNILEKVSEFNDIKSIIEKTQYTNTFLTKDIKALKVKYNNLKNQNENPFTDLLNKTKQQVSSLQDNVVKYVSHRQHLEILREACSETGVKRFIIKDIVKLLNSLIQKYLNEIGAEYLVYFDESFDFKFITINGECEYSSFSAGQRQRIQIATILAFRDLILNGKINSNIFVLDEFLDAAIDSIAIKNIMNILSKKSKELNQNIFIISHRQETTEENAFNHIIQVIKENGISRLNIN